MDMGLAGRHVFVAASSGGLGLATAIGFAREGADVVINGRDADRLEQARLAVDSAGTGKVLALVGDVSDPAVLDRVTTAALDAFGTIDVLVNNAGGPPPGPFDALDDSHWQTAVDLTLMSAVRLTRAFLPGMKAQRWGRVVNISSFGVKQPVPGLTLSNAIRMAVLGWSKTLSGQVAADGVLVNTICPGWTRTGRVDSLFAARAKAENRSVAEIEAQITANIPMGRLGTPEEFAKMAVFLGSEAASYMTGVAVQVDGGTVQGYM